MISKQTIISPSVSSIAPANEPILLQQQDIKKESLYQIPIHSKLSIGAEGNIPDKVMRMEKPSSLNFSSAKDHVRRKCVHYEEEEKQLQRKEGNVNSDSIAPSIVNDILSFSGGRSLDTETRSFMEPRFNYDFSNVRIHDNNIAAKSADSINALAYTSGNSIVFNSGQYNTNSDSGKRLLAHELTHIIQQNNGANSSIKQKPNQPLLQRKWKIKPRTSGTNPLNKGGETDEKILEDGFKEICPLTSRTGDTISLLAGPPIPSSTEGCDCLRVIDSKIGTLFTSDPEIQVEPFGWSQSLPTSTPSVSVRHPEDPFSWGYWTGTSATHPKETRHVKPFWQTLAHEVCGHIGAFARSGGGPAGKRGVGTGHNVAIEGENLVAAEHGVTPDEQRGLDMTASGKPLPGHRGESFLQAIVPDFIHASDSLPTATAAIVDAVVNTVSTTGVFPEMLIQVEGFAHSSEGGKALASKRAGNVKNEIIAKLTAAKLSVKTSVGASRFFPTLSSISAGTSSPGTPSPGRMVKVFLFHQAHSAGP